MSKERKFDSNQYWEDRYNKGGNSGKGSYNDLAKFKASIINNYIKRYNIKKIYDFGVGDGNQLKLLKCPEYTGFDVSGTIISKVKKIFQNDNNKKFMLLDEFDRKEKADLSLSCDVLYHLINYDIWESHIKDLFESSNKYVIIYSSNFNKDYGKHCKSRNFTNFIKKKYPNWSLFKIINNKYPKKSISDFYIFSLKK